MFAYHDAVAERYPTIRAGVIHATGLANGPSPSDVLDGYRAEQRRRRETERHRDSRSPLDRRMAARLHEIRRQTDPTPQRRRGATAKTRQAW
jgi:hypothetical protein